MYNEKVLSIFKNPKNAGGLKGSNGIGKVGDAADGDVIKLYLVIENEIVKNAQFKAFGSVATIVASSAAAELVKGKTLEDVLKIKNSDILKYLGELPESKIYVALLAENAIKSAVEDYYKKKQKELKDKNED